MVGGEDDDDDDQVMIMWLLKSPHSYISYNFRRQLNDRCFSYCAATVLNALPKDFLHPAGLSTATTFLPVLVLSSARFYF
jgi:hypothetical protein